MVRASAVSTANKKCQLVGGGSHSIVGVGVVKVLQLSCIKHDKKAMYNAFEL